MSKFFAIFRIRWVIQLLGIIALGVIIWFVGPLIAIAGIVPLESPLARAVTIVILVLLWLINLLWSRLKSKKADQVMVEELSHTEESAPDQSKEELQRLKERFDQALAVLKKSRKGGWLSSNQYLYELPWYVIIGPPGSGKTTILVNSGLRFSQTENSPDKKVEGVGGTRNCHWWFTEDAILLDTAGRYTTQDHNAAVDSSAWMGFLGLLKKHRKRRPINGILIAVSVTDLMLYTEEERGMHARAIRNRIQELNEQLGVQAPVYMMFTKCDLVAGFTEFFEDMGREERAQVWGFTLPLAQSESKDGALESIGLEYDSLLRRIDERVLWRIDQERDIQRRNLIYGFPQEFAALRDSVSSLLRGIFESSRFESSSLLRGAYFTSGTQEGTPIDRLMGNLAQSFGLDRTRLPAFSGRGRSYFIQALFREVIFPEANLAGTDRKLESRRTWIRRGAYVTALGLTAGTILAWSTSFTRNQMEIGNLESEVSDYQQGILELPLRTVDFSKLVEILDELRSSTEIYPEDVPLSMGMGLYQGKKLDQAAESAYRRVLNGRFLYSLGARLEQHLQDTSQPLLREALKAYLMLGQPKYMNAEEFRIFMLLDWENTLPGENVKQQHLMTHLDTLLSGKFPPLPMNHELIHQARSALLTIPLEQQIYTRIKKQAATDHSLDFLLIDALGRRGDKVFAARTGTLNQMSIPGLYTHKGYYSVFLPESLRLTKETLKEDWVLADEGSENHSEVKLLRLQSRLKEYYVEDYIRHWKQLLGEIQIVRINKGLRHAVDVLDVATGPASPIRKLLQAVADNTKLSHPPLGAIGGLPAGEGVKSVAEVAANMSTQAQIQKQRLEKLMRAGKSAGVGIDGVSKDDGLISQVEDEFQLLDEMVQKRDDKTTPLDDVFERLVDLLNLLVDLNSVGNRGGAALEAAIRQVSGNGEDPVTELVRYAKTRLRWPIKNWVIDLAEGSWGTVVDSTNDQLGILWKGSVLALYNKGIAGRYPLDPNNDLEVTLTDFGRMFGPGRVLDSFFNKNIAPFVNTDTIPWRWRDKGGHPGVSEESLVEFERAAHIRDTFFSHGGDKPRIEFSLKPVYLDSKARRIVIDLAGQKVVYRHGPARSFKLVWPAPSDTGYVRITFENQHGEKSSRTTEGPWAWFKLLDQAQIRNTQLADRFLVVFELGGNTARFELRASSIVNPFQMQPLREFTCPTKL
ncbi:MAG: type VI secretion system membrane subunit TssM [Gammaproteobacteria bacterium]|nr:type VI secretion system membrane subunit TssM [Gammaproteobacteria bacterium]